MNFLKKIKPVILKCYTSQQSLNLTFPINTAINFIPEWCKNLPSTINYTDTTANIVYPCGTLKRCYGFNELFKQGFMIPMWSDCILKIDAINNQNFAYKFSDGASKISYHPKELFLNVFDQNKYQHLKFVSPWLFVCDEEINFMYTQPTWNQATEEQITVLPGVVEYKYQHCTDINVMIERTQEERQVLINAGTPMVHIVPITERKVILETKYITETEKQSIINKYGRLKFLSSYNFYKKIVSKNKCPFHKQ